MINGLRMRDHTESRWHCKAISNKLKRNFKSKKVSSDAQNEIEAAQMFTHRTLRAKRCLDQTHENFTCDVCFTILESEQKLRTHIKSHLTRKCKICSKSVRRRQLTPHMKTHDTSVHFECDLCSRQFIGRRNFLQHFRSVHPKGHYSCTILGCHKKFEHLKHLMMHGKIHVGKDQYKCLVCGEVNQNCRKFFKHTKDCHRPGKAFLQCLRQLKFKCQIRSRRWIKSRTTLKVSCIDSSSLFLFFHLPKGTKNHFQLQKAAHQSQILMNPRFIFSFISAFESISE